MRKPFVAGNWKMNTTASTARELAGEIVRGVGDNPRVAVAVCPPFPYLQEIRDVVDGSAVALGAQNCHDKPHGAFTGEVGAPMLKDLGCRWVILGHSERRHGLGETNAFINRKVHAALNAGLSVILCVGETEEERKAGRYEEIFQHQGRECLVGIDAQALENLVIAYEPVWAIGTGQTATPEQAQAAHVFIRSRVAQLFGEKAAAAIPILYGGSVTAANARDLFAMPDLDGGLIGGASLKAKDFLAIVEAAAGAQGSP
jgi:triosephosphate isomerase